MTKSEEIEFECVLEALDVAKQRLRDMANLHGSPLEFFARWAQKVLREIDAAENGGQDEREAGE